MSMANMLRRGLALVLISCCVFGAALPVPVRAAYSDGVEAYAAGNAKRALALWIEAADAGNADAQWAVGNMLVRGEGSGIADPARAAGYYRKAAESGHLEAQVSLATLYRIGKGVDQDYGAAAKWLYRAATAGHPVAQADLADMFLGGENGKVASNPSYAFDWYRHAAEAGVILAQVKLGQLYIEGIGTEKPDPRRGMVWLTVARRYALQREEPYWSRRVLPLDRVIEADPEKRSLRQFALAAYAEAVRRLPADDVRYADVVASNWNPAK